MTETDPHFERLLEDVKELRGFDFTGYKRASIMRRVRRRMQVVGVTSFEAYRDYLLVNADEFTALFNTILINVTAFFRDREAWQYLDTKVLPPLLEAKEGQPIRAWSAGCSSGEEAYTLAMLFAEQLGIEEFRDRVKIYATDVDDEALAAARQAVYSDQAIQGVPEELREKYFERNGQGFSFRKELRRSVIFGRNDLVQDAPISHVDVLACRNTLMYFNAETQAQILQRLHFALNPDGVLFLGRAEMLLSHARLFQPIELNRRFFTKVVPPGARPGLGKLPTETSGTEATHHARLREAALMSSASAQLVLDSDGKLAFSNARAAHYFGLGPKDIGRPIQDLEVSYRPIELRTPISQAVRERRTVWVRGVPWARAESEPLSFDLQFIPLVDELGNLLGSTVIFNDVTHYRQLQQELEHANRSLETAYEELQSTNEELETTNEELQSTVEELETTNEELQSTNEELETMNEELQSMNDELHITNEALRERQDEVDHLNGFMAAVLDSMSAGVAVVDKDLRITAWNAKAQDLWGVRTEEAVGEHLLTLDIGLPLQQLRPILRRQLADGSNKGGESIRVNAVNRRGKPVEVHVIASRLAGAGAGSSGAILAHSPGPAPSPRPAHGGPRVLTRTKARAMAPKRPPCDD
ncbi:CheR family methyltransferase [Intrasporangium sp.]|uniref:CheR family methyltransferase n=1 Tax=Intrasporangium sp. TaxID=1925024 RepID=UPI0033655C92